MVETLLLDCGGVMCRPVTGLWVFPRNFHAIMDKYLTGIDMQKHREAINYALAIMDTKHHLYTEEEDCAQHRDYFADCYRVKLGLPVTDDELDELAIGMAYDDDRFLFYDDCMAYMRKWHGQYRMALVSDTQPDLRRALRNKGYLQYLDAASLSCENGVYKPDPLMYTAALDALGAKAETAVFVDDVDKNLYGARKVGVRAVKMTRPVYQDYQIPVKSDWDGPVVESFEALDKLLGEL